MNICIPHARLVPTEVRCRHQTPWNWSYRWLLATMWVLGTDLRPFVRESSALNHGGIPLALKNTSNRISSAANMHEVNSLLTSKWYSATILKNSIKMHVSFLNSGTFVDEKELEVKIFHLEAYCWPAVGS